MDRRDAVPVRNGADATTMEEGQGVSPSRPASPHMDVDASPQRQAPSDMASPNTETGGSPTVEGEKHEWSAFYDASGQIYYYNNATQESSWEVPEEGFNPPPPHEDEEVAQTEAEESELAPPTGLASPTQPIEPSTPIAQEPSNMDAEPKGDIAFEAKTEPADTGSNENNRQGPWNEYTDDSGQIYYYNSETGETQWEKPTEIVSTAIPEVQELSSPKHPKSPTESPQSMDTTEEHDEAKSEEKVEEPEEEPEEEIDPIAKRLDDAEKSLNEPDAIMEPTVLGNVLELLTQLGGSVGGKKAITSLVDGFQGQTAICGLLGMWLADIKSSSSSDSGSTASQQKNTFNKAADSVRDIVQDTVNRIAKERFTKSGGDNILNLPKSEVAFLEAMMDSNRWRQLLIDLSASNKDSALLMYCLQSISKRGHHREIARRINQSDHFAVYDAMLASEFAVIGMVANSAAGDGVTSIGTYELVADLRRTCTSTSYTYLYAVEVLRALLSKTRKEDSSRAAMLASRKWERLREELESAMIDPSTCASTAGSSPLFRKRRLDTALIMSDLHQRQRRRLKPSSDTAIDERNGHGKHNNSLEVSLLSLLKRHSLGTRLDVSTLDQLLQHETGFSRKGEVGKILQSHPLSIKVLLDQLFKPGASRMGSTATKQKCARLIALAVITGEKIVLDEVKQRINASEISVDTDEVSLTSKLISGSQLCERVENMVSFTVTADDATGVEGLSPGRKLCSLALKNAVIAQGAILWATEIAKGPEFVTSASYQSLTPSILSLVRLISIRHPCTRRAVVEIPFIFLKHSNSEISFQKMNALKEQSLRLLLFLLVSREVKVVLDEVSSRLRQQRTSEIDAALVRYFVVGLLNAIRPPYSLVMVRSLGHLLSAPRCEEAVISTYFSESSKLLEVIRNFKKTLESSACSTNDKALVSSLVSTYKVSG